jgi:hypothetical protein
MLLLKECNWCQCPLYRVGRFLDFFDNWWFRVFEKQSESDNYRFWVVDKKIRIRERCVLVVSKASKNGERFTKNNCKIAGDFLGFRWLFQEYWGPWLISELGIWLFDEHDYMSKLEIWLFRPVTINPKNRPATQKGFGSDSDNRPTLIHYTSKFLPKYRFMAHWKNLVWKKFHSLQHSRVWTRIRLQIENPRASKS